MSSSYNITDLGNGRVSVSHTAVYFAPPIPSLKNGNLVQPNIIGTVSQYPSNGLHTDGYWYVRKGIANQTPSLTISSPTDSLNFNNSISAQGTITDTRVYSQNYSGTVSTPDTRTYGYKQDYSGTVSTPDTRVYSQNYSGIGYKSGTDYYYSYNVQVNYESNTPPTVAITSPTNSQKTRSNVGVNGSITDPDNDTWDLDYAVSK